ncbi:hypothetical protein MYA_0829 [Burkholderia sp. KJ006]|nr:hypothetical protein MYA_0829 [Burkholderia sp. KJ006]
MLTAPDGRRGVRRTVCAIVRRPQCRRVVSFAHGRRIRHFPMNYAEHYKSTK